MSLCCPWVTTSGSSRSPWTSASPSQAPKATYLGEADVGGDGLKQAIRRLAAELIEGADDIYLLRPVPSTDGPPFRACLIYRRIQAGLDVERLDPRFDTRYVPPRKVRTVRYNTIKAGGAYPWERDFEAGGQACFLTGKGATATWRLTRLETDARERQVLTLAPIRLPHPIAAPNFDLVQDPRLQDYLIEQFEAFRRAMAGGAHFEVVD